MRALTEDEKFDLLVRAIAPASRLLGAWALAGGVSAQVTALEVARPAGGVQRMVVRQHGAVDLAHNPQIAADEFRLLQLLHAAGLPVPQPYYCDQYGELFAKSLIVMEYIEGQTEVAPAAVPDAVRQLALYLARIHQLNEATLDLSFLPKQAAIYAERIGERPATVDAHFEEGRIRAILAAAWPWPQQNGAGLLHGDFWPGNILWQEGRLAAILDWEDAQVGDPLADVANSRLEILWTWGPAALEGFTTHYQTQTALDFAGLPYYDLAAALRPMGKFTEWAADAAAAATMRDRLRWFITQAFDALMAQGLG